VTAQSDARPRWRKNPPYGVGGLAVEAEAHRLRPEGLPRGWLSGATQITATKRVKEFPGQDTSGAAFPMSPRRRIFYHESHFAMARNTQCE
jgi:hypothetical protein